MSSQYLINGVPPDLNTIDTQTTLYRQQVYLQAKLQHLLDAQSAGLLAGLSDVPPSSRDRSTTPSATGSDTPSVISPPPSTKSGFRWADDEAAPIPVRQPKPHKIGLSSARRGISRAMTELALLKLQQAETLEVQMAEKDEDHATVQRIMQKEAGLREQIEKIQAGGSIGRRIGELQQEGEVLGEEIRELETRLSQMRARQRVLRGRIEEGVNGIQARMSSYQHALGLVERESKDFLSRMPGNDKRARTGLWALPAERRTLEMASEQFADEQKGLRGSIEQAEKERDALEEGGAMWQKAVVEIQGVEESLKAEMGKMQSFVLDRAGDEDERRQVGMQRILARMAKTEAQLDKDLHIARQKDWGLLVCAIGTELEALIQGERILREAFVQVHGGNELLVDASRDGSDHSGHMASEVNGHSSEVDALHKLDEGDELLQQAVDEDEDPGPDLLISHD